MKKLLAILFLIMTVQAIAETVVKGTYETKKKRYVELTETFEKEIFLNYTLPDDKKEIVTYKGKDFDILVSKNDLLELYNRRRVDKIDDIKRVYSHEQALMQCSEFLGKYPKWEKVKMNNTALSAKYIGDTGNKENACIANRKTKEMYNLELLQADINNEKES